ncbi:MAG TPA: suppressor of fused domain protein [Mycobacterium sp.]
MTDVAADVRAHLRADFARAGEPDAASVTFLGVEPVDVLRFGPDTHGVVHYASVGGSRHADGNPAEVVISLRSGANLPGLARSVAVVAAAPAVEGLVLTPDALVDLGQPLWQGAPFTAVLLADSVIDDMPPVVFLSATPITPTEAPWVRLKGVDAMRQAWQQDGVDVLDPARKASSPAG